jgi:hypothetical protein
MNVAIRVLNVRGLLCVQDKVMHEAAEQAQQTQNVDSLLSLTDQIDKELDADRDGDGRVDQIMLSKEQAGPSLWLALCLLSRQSVVHHSIPDVCKAKAISNRCSIC